ncbi:hypothetical protein F5Y14DRAFT_335581 [Nemania sp. NC0429]|nr:hypothetical protein F5Y14DRAFT_335581 [Nemania sp. NC0429]
MTLVGARSLVRAAARPGTHPCHRCLSLRHPLQPGHTTTRISSLPFDPVNQQGRRCFHWQSAIGTAIEGTQSLLVDLHTATNLPWFLAIPLAAFAVGAVFRLPASVYAQRVLRRRTQCLPLLQAWNSRITHDVQREGIPAERWVPEIKKRQDKALHRMYRNLSLQNWRLYSTSLLGFPFWLIAIDGVRRLCGGPRGLIGSLVAGSAVPAESTRAAGADAATTASSLPLDPMADPSIFAADPTPASVVAETTTATAHVVDPSLSFEGCLWFTDLTASDPYHILPLALSCTLVWNLIPKSDAPLADRLRIAFGRQPMSTQAGHDEVELGRGWRSRLSRFMMALAILVGPLTMDLPAALHLYWLTSSATNALFMAVLRRLMPVKGALRRRCMGVESPIIRPRRAGA